MSDNLSFAKAKLLVLGYFRNKKIQNFHPNHDDPEKNRSLPGLPSNYALLYAFLEYYSSQNQPSFSNVTLRVKDH